MEALKPETWQPEPRGAASAGRLSAAAVASGSGDERYADPLMSQARRSPGYAERDGTEGWRPNAERPQSRLSQDPLQDDEAPGVEERTSSGATVPDEAVGAPLRVEAPAPGPPSGGCPGHSEGPPGSWGTARLRCTPGREQVRLCELGSVKNGWLPIHKRALLFGVPLHVRNTEHPPSQKKMKAYIAATTPKGYTKKLYGNGHIDGNRVEKWSPPVSFRPLRSLSHSNINQSSSCLNASDGERKMYEERRTCWPSRSGFIQSNVSHVDGGVALCRGSPVQRTVSVPGTPCPQDTDSKNPPKTKASFSSITITARRVFQTASLPSREGPEPGCMNQAGGPVTQARGLITQARGPITQAVGPVTHARGPISQARGPMIQAGDTTTKASEPHPAKAASSTPTALRPCADSAHAPVVLRKKPVIIKVSEHRQAYCPGERAAGTRPPEFRHSYSEGDHKEDALSGFQGGLRDPRAESVRSCAHLDLPSGSTNSVLYLDKSLSISLEAPERQREVHRSTLSLYLSRPPPTAASEGSDVPRRALSCSDRFVHPSPAPPALNALKHWKPWSLPGKWDPRTVSDGPSSSNTSSSAPVPRPGDARQSRTETVKHGGKPDEEARPRPADLEPRLPVSGQLRERVAHRGLGEIFARSPDPVVAVMKQQSKSTPKSTPAQGLKTAPDSSTAQREDSGNRSKSLCVEGVVRRSPRRAGCENGRSRPSSWTGSFPISQDCTANSLTLREALELYRPDFISRSQGRVKELEERVQKRQADQNSDAVLEPARGRRRRNCTKPHPLSDNLFRPRERSISRKDMQLRSKRIYNRLPEVTRKQEEEKKKVLSQTNRLRAEIFKKKLLDQILQRNGD